MVEGDQMKPYTVASLADRWGCSVWAIYALIKDGRLPAFRLGGKLLRIRAEDVEKWESTGGSTALENTASDNLKAKPSSSGRTKRDKLTAEDDAGRAPDPFVDAAERAALGL